MRRFDVVIWGYAFYILANVLDICSSLGRLEANELMRMDGLLVFDPWRGIKVKAAFLAYYLGII